MKESEEVSGTLVVAEQVALSPRWIADHDKGRVHVTGRRYSSSAAARLPVTWYYQYLLGPLIIFVCLDYAHECSSICDAEFSDVEGMMMLRPANISPLQCAN